MLQNVKDKFSRAFEAFRIKPNSAEHLRIMKMAVASNLGKSKRKVMRKQPYGRHIDEVQARGRTYMYHATKGWRSQHNQPGEASLIYGLIKRAGVSERHDPFKTLLGSN